MRPEHWVYTIPLQLRSLFRRRQADHELDEELREHVKRKTEENIAAGMTAEEARRQALLEMGGIEKRKEECRDARRVRWVQDLLQDLPYALRMLRRSPGFTAAAVLTLALGIGANTAIFSVVNSVLLETLPVKDPQRLVIIRLPGPHGGYDGIPYATFEYFRDHNNVLSDTYASCVPEHLDVGINGQAELASGQVVSGSYYSSLGVSTVLGRTITSGDDAPGSPPVAVLGYRYWKQRFRADPSVLGKNIKINGADFTVVGVTPPGFFGLMAGFSPDVTASMSMLPRLMADGSVPNDMQTWNVETVGGRLKRDVTLEQARADLDVLFHQRVGVGHQHDNPKIEVIRGSRGLPIVRNLFAQPLIVLMAAVGLVLLISCANVANLLLARGTARRKEIAMRLALGASRQRLIRQLLTESVLLALFGGALGLAFAVWVTHLLLTIISGAGLPVSITAQIDSRVLGFTCLAALLTGVLFGLVPAIRATRINLIPDLKPGPTTGTKRQVGLDLGQVMVVSQIAVALLLLVGVGLLVRTLRDLQDVHPGFDAEHVLLFTVEPHLVGYKDARLTELYQDLLESVQSLPGVRAVSASRFTPLTPGSVTETISTSGHAQPTGENPTVQESFVGPNFFQAMGVPLLFGRDFTLQDAEGAPQVALVNEAAALRYFQNRNPIGADFTLSERKGSIHVIGVVKDAKYRSLREPTTAMVFLPLLQFSPEAQRLTFEVRTAASPGTTAAAVRQRIEEIDRNLAMIDVKTLTEQIGQTLMPERLVTTLSSLFALLALVLACVGLYGVMSYAMRRKTNEIGIRLALGAQRADILCLVLGQGFKLTVIGVVLGIAGALGLTRFLSSLLYGVGTTDPLTFTAVSLILVGAALLASYIPARRAMRVDPMVALRYE
jgi:predicted permease